MVPLRQDENLALVRADATTHPLDQPRVAPYHFASAERVLGDIIGGATNG